MNDIAPASPQPDASGTSTPFVPTEAENTAIAQSALLLGYAGENLANLDAKLAASLSEAINAREAGRWSPAMSAQFWEAFNKLCDKIKPVTIDCLCAQCRNRERRRWLFWKSNTLESLGERCSRQYISTLVVLLLIAVPLQLLVWVYSNQSQEISKQLGAIGTNVDSLQRKCDELLVRLPANAVPQGRDDMMALFQVESEESLLTQRTVSLRQATHVLHNWIHFNVGDPAPEAAASTSAPKAKPDWSENCNAIVTAANLQKDRSDDLLGKASLWGAILLQFVLPILFGTIGALAYVLRNTSDQIKSATFSSTAPIRNWVRIMLGALMGLVIGLFTGLSTNVSLPPLALAFLAGYGVEAVFSMFDRLIGQLKKAGAK